jgi:hypothetical protein
MDSDQQKKRISRALVELMDPVMLQQFSALWYSNKQEAALALVGIEERDVDVYRELIRPHEAALMGPSSTQKDRLADGFSRLLDDPEKLKLFINKWRSDSREALTMIDLRPEDQIAWQQHIGNIARRGGEVAFPNFPPIPIWAPPLDPIVPGQ